MGANEDFTTVFRVKGVSEVNAGFAALGVGAENIGNGLERIGGAAHSAITKLGNVAQAAMTMAAGAAGLATGAVAAIGVEAVKTASTFEQLQIKLAAVMGTAQGGKDAFAWITQIEPKLPFTKEQITDLTTSMLAMGLDPFKQMTTIADMALGDFERTKSIAEALGKIKMQNIYTGEEGRMLVESGQVPAPVIMQKAFKLTSRQMQDIATMRIPADSAIAAILGWGQTERKGAALAQMDAIKGKMTNLETQYKNFLNNIGVAMAPAVSGVMDRLTAWFKNPANQMMAVKFFSYALAIVETLGETVGKMLKSLFEGHGKPKWLLEMGIEMLDLIEKAFLYRMLLSHIELAGDTLKGMLKSGSMLGALGIAFGGTVGQMGLVAGSAIGKSFLEKGKTDLRGELLLASGPSIADLAKPFNMADIGTRANAISAQAQKALAAAQGDAGAAKAPGAGAGALGSGTMERFILGGGEFASKWSRYMPGVGHAAARPKVHVDVTSTDNSPLGKAVQQIAAAVLGVALRDPAVLKYLKSATA